MERWSEFDEIERGVIAAGLMLLRREIRDVGQGIDGVIDAVAAGMLAEVDGTFADDEAPAAA